MTTEKKIVDLQAARRQRRDKTGWSRRWMIRPRAAIAAATESTRNGMSSLAMHRRIRRCPSSVLDDSILTTAAPGARRAQAVAMNSAAACRSSSLKPSSSPGSAPWHRALASLSST